MDREISKLGVLLCLFLGGCASTIHVDLADSQIVNMSHEKLGISSSSSSSDKISRVIEFKIVTDKNLLEYYTFERNYPINIVCKAEGADRKENLRSGGFGPFYKGVNLSKILLPNDPNRKKIVSNDSKKYEYIVYSFIDLEAGYTQLHYGMPETSLKLEREKFVSVGCYISGFAYPPFIPPRSNIFGVSKLEFEKMLIKYNETNK